MSSSNLKKLNISMEAIKKRLQGPEPNLSHSLIDTTSLDDIRVSPKMKISINPDFTATSDKTDRKTSRSSPNKSKRSRRAAFRIQSPKYLTAIAQQTIPSNTEGQATILLPFICHCISTHIRIFHVSWIALFVCFLSWIIVLQSSSDLHLSSTDQLIANILQYSSSVVFSIFFGDLCDKIGARYSYVLLLTISFISLTSLTFAPFAPVVYMILSFFVGINAAAFVITQYHITSFFSSTCVGFANGLATGYGVLVAGLMANLFPLLSHAVHFHSLMSYDITCRYAMVLPMVFIFIMIFVYYRFTIEAPKGNISKENAISFKIICAMKRYKWKRIVSDYRIWILSLAYGACFGVEQTLLNYSVSSNSYSNTIVFALNLFTRAFGGYISDLLYLKYGIQGRVYCLFWSLLFEALFIVMFAFNSFGVADYSDLMMLFAALYAQITQGIVFAIVPNLPHQLYIGLCMGIVAAGGPFGSIFGELLFEYSVSYQTAWILCSVFVFCASLAVLLVKFTKKEIADDLRSISNDYWTSVGTTFRSKPVANDSGDTKSTSPGFVIH